MGRSNADEQFMQRALTLAEHGAGRVAPNPMVGAVLVRAGRIVGEGFHRRLGAPHAEIEAIRDAGKRAAGSHLYVTLEPCNHVGRTGPCTDAILAAGIRAVTYALRDPNRQVRGNGAARLRRAGLSVRSGLCIRQARQINEVYLTWHRSARPFVILKLAQSLDGSLATATGDSRWLTSVQSRTEVHQLRARYDAVLVGAETIRKDDPSLTVRHVRGKNPFRIVVTRSGHIPASALVVRNNSDRRTIIAAPESAVRKLKKALDASVDYWTIPADSLGVQTDLLLGHAATAGIQSILIEGGERMATAFLRKQLVDKLVIYSAPLVIGSARRSVGDLAISVVSEGIRFRQSTWTPVGTDIRFVGYPLWRS